MKYRLKTAVSGEIPVLGHRYAFDFAATRTTPQSEQDEAAFEYLVDIGWAERLPETKAAPKTEEPVIEAEDEPPPEPTEEEA